MAGAEQRAEQEFGGAEQRIGGEPVHTEVVFTQRITIVTPQDIYPGIYSLVDAHESGPSMEQIHDQPITSQA